MPRLGLWQSSNERMQGPDASRGHKLLSTTAWLMRNSLLLSAMATRAVLGWVMAPPTRTSLARLRAGGGLASRVAMSSSAEHFDYLVIGGGSGGIASARRAATYGKRVAVVERGGTGGLGGTCVNVGCVPKKIMFNAATVYESIHEAHQFKFEGDADALKLNWGALKDARDKYITRLNGIYERNLANSDVEKVTGTARFTGPNTVAVDGADGATTELSADHVLIAVGGTPSMPDIPGAEHCINSDGFFELEDMPARVAVVGAGYIAVEMAGIFSALGSATQLFVRGATPLRWADEYIVGALTKEMERQGLALMPHSTPTKVTKDANTGALTMETADGKSHGPFDCVLMATGRTPLVEPLALDKAGVKTDAKGYIQVDELQRTGVDGVFALGDVCGNVELTPMAIAAGRRLADRLFDGAGDWSKGDYNDVPTVIFSHPPIGTIGLSEAKAKEIHGEENIKCYTSMFVNLWYGPWQIEPSDKPRSAYKVSARGRARSYGRAWRACLFDARRCREILSLPPSVPAPPLSRSSCASGLRSA